MDRDNLPVDAYIRREERRDRWAEEFKRYQETAPSGGRYSPRRDIHSGHPQHGHGNHKGDTL